jgi:hypothetical protein
MMRKARIAYIWSAIPQSTDIDRGHNNVAAGSKSVRLAASRCFPLFNQFQTFVYAAGGAASCQKPTWDKRDLIWLVSRGRRPSPH